MATKLISEATPKSSLAISDMIPLAADGLATAYHITGQALFDSIPAATTEDDGVVELATDAEVAAGTAAKIPDASQLALLLQTSGARQADTGGDARGTDSNDLQSNRSNADEVAEGKYGFIGGGADNKIPANDDYSAVAGGRENEAGNDYAMVAGGYGAVAGLYGEHAHAAGYFATPGDAQYRRVVARISNTFSSTSWATLYPDGASQLLVIPSDTVWTFEALIVGTTSGCDKSFGFKIQGVLENDGGTTSLLASTVTTIYDTDDTSFDARANANNVNDTLEIQVQDTDSGGDTVRFVAVIEIVQVQF